MGDLESLELKLDKLMDQIGAQEHALEELVAGLSRAIWGSTKKSNGTCH